MPAGATADFQLVPGGVIEGIVRDERSREPVAAPCRRSRARYAGDVRRERARPARDDKADGRFRLAGLRPGAYSLDREGREARREVADARRARCRGAGHRCRDPRRGRADRFAASSSTNAARPRPMSRSMRLVPATKSTGKSDAKGAFVIDGVAPGQLHAARAAAISSCRRDRRRVEVADKDVDGIKITRHARPARQRSRRARGRSATSKLDAGHAAARCDADAVRAGDDDRRRRVRYRSRCTPARSI